MECFSVDDSRKKLIDMTTEVPVVHIQADWNEWIVDCNMI